MYYPPDWALMLFMPAPPPSTLAGKKIKMMELLTRLRPLSTKYSTYYLTCSFRLAVFQRWLSTSWHGCGTACCAACCPDEYNHCARAVEVARCERISVLEAYTCNRGTDSIQLSMDEVSLPGDSVATYLAFVTWCLVKVVVETLD